VGNARRVWLAIAVIVAALVVVDVLAPHAARVVPRSPLLAGIIVGAVIVYIVTRIVGADVRLRLRLPRIRRPRRLRPVRRDTDAATKFIDEFERRHRR
jgi:hypothetical protein